MSAPRITAITAVPPSSAGARRAPTTALALREPQAGETLSLQLQAEDGLLRPTDHDGAPVALPAEALQGELLGNELSPGDVLLVKVLSTTPRLELARLGTLPATRAATADDGALNALLRDAPSSRNGAPSALATGAMHPDQTAMLRMAWASPDAAILSSSWRVLVLEHLRQLAQNPLAAGPAGAQRQAASSDAASLPAWGLLSRWVFPIHAWSGLPLSLRLLPPRGHAHEAPVDPASGRPRAEADVWGLRLSGDLPGLGPTDLRATLSVHGVGLMVLVQEAQALQRLRQGQAHLAQAVHRAGWRLRQCQLLKQLPDDQEPAPLPGMPPMPPIGQLLHPQDMHAHPVSLSLHGLPQALFRVAAEVLITLGQLGQLSSEEPINPASR